MILHMWSTDADGNMWHDDENEYVTVESSAEATSELVKTLYHTASDDFMHKALAQWFFNGRISNLPAGNETFWHVELKD